MMTMFAKRFRSLRNKNSETQQDLADVFHVSRGMVSLWEQGKNFPEVTKLIEIAAYFDVTTDYLLGLSNSNVTLSAGAVSGNHNTVNSHNTINSVTHTTPDEAELLALWRTAPKEKKNAILQLLK